jgi:hypothetical protein
MAAFVTLATAVSAQHAARPTAQKGTRIQGRIVRMQGPDRFVVRTTDKREVILHSNAQTKFLLNSRAARFSDLREGVDIDAIFDVNGDLNVVSSVIITPAGVVEQVPPDVTVIEGTIVRIQEPDNIVVRTSRGEEVILVTDARTSFTLNERAGRLVDFRPGMAVRAQFDVRDRKNIVRSVTSMPRRIR